MCLSAQALALFLNILPYEIISVEPDRITIFAETQTAVWQISNDQWCTSVPTIADAATPSGPILDRALALPHESQ